METTYRVLQLKKKKGTMGPINYAQREFIKYEFKYIYVNQIAPSPRVLYWSTATLVFMCVA